MPSKRSNGAFPPSTTISCDRERFASEGRGERRLWSRLPSRKNQTLTPNPDAVYLMPFFNTRAGPMVLEIPPASDEGSITGDIDDVWQLPLEEVGPEGVDKGKGGKLLILPPGYKDKRPRATSRFPPKPTAISPSCAPFTGRDRRGQRQGDRHGKRVKRDFRSASRRPTPDDVRGRDRCGVQRRHSLRSELFQSLDHIVQTELRLKGTRR